MHSTQHLLIDPDPPTIFLRAEITSIGTPARPVILTQVRGRTKALEPVDIDDTQTHSTIAEAKAAVSALLTRL